MRGSMKGTWGNTVKEIDAYIKSERKSWNKFRLQQQFDKNLKKLEACQ